MQKSTLSPEQSCAPRSGRPPNFSYGASDQTNGMRMPTGIESLRSRFNPRLIGFGIAGPSLLDWNEKEHSSEYVPATRIFSARNPED